MARARILVADDHTLIVDAFKKLLLKNTGFGAITWDLVYLALFATVAMTAEAKATTPVPPNTTTRLPLNSVENCFLSAVSAQATMAAAVVKEPAGSANRR